jgi:hypothetical protein
MEVIAASTVSHRRRSFDPAITMTTTKISNAQVMPIDIASRPDSQTGAARTKVGRKVFPR